MTKPVQQEPVRKRRFGQRYGCFVVVLLLVALAGSLFYATLQPLPGVVIAVALLALGFWLLRYAARREREEALQEVARLCAVAQPLGDAWRALLENEGLGSLVEELAERVRPALRLATCPTQGALAVGQSRIGGLPDLPPDLAWPVHDGKPMMFLAQLDLAAVRGSLPRSPLPASGHLWFFYSCAQPWGFDPQDAGGSRVIFRSDGASLAPSTPPSGLPAEARFPACAVSFKAYDDLPDLDGEVLPPPLDDEKAERYVEIRTFLASGGSGPSHKLLGFADPIQGPMELECQLVTNGLYCGDPSGFKDPRATALAAGSSDWQPLLQIDSDERARMMWGDAGRLYFWMRAADLREQRFERAWLILQCY